MLANLSDLSCYICSLQEWETTSRALRSDVNVLQRSMNEMREMMESSIQMQFELQRSIRQEISGALQRIYIGKGMEIVRKLLEL